MVSSTLLMILLYSFLWLSLMMLRIFVLNGITSSFPFIFSLLSILLIKVSACSLRTDLSSSREFLNRVRCYLRVLIIQCRAYSLKSKSDWTWETKLHLSWIIFISGFNWKERLDLIKLAQICILDKSTRSCNNFKINFEIII